MKGINTIIVNEEQMVSIVNKWWQGITYSDNNDKVVSVSEGSYGNFEITLEEDERATK